MIAILVPLFIWLLMISVILVPLFIWLLMISVENKFR